MADHRHDVDAMCAHLAHVWSDLPDVVILAHPTWPDGRTLVTAHDADGRRIDARLVTPEEQ